MINLCSKHRVSLVLRRTHNRASRVAPPARAILGCQKFGVQAFFKKWPPFWAVSCPEIFQKCVLCMENPVLQTDETTAISIRPEAVQQTGMTRAMARGAALLLLLGMAAATHEYCSPGAFALNVSRTHPSTVRACVARVPNVVEGRAGGACRSAPEACPPVLHRTERLRASSRWLWR